MSRRWWTLVAVSLATFMTYLDNNVTNVAIPTIQREPAPVARGPGVGGQQLHPGVRRAAAGRRPAGRRVRPAAAVRDRAVGVHAGLARRRAGRQRRRADRRAAACRASARRWSCRPRWRSSWRRSTTSGSARRAIGAWTAIGAMALAFGPLIGGFISQHLHWGWIFFINVPVGVVTVGDRALSAMRESRDPSVVRHLDVPGLISSAVALFALTYALIEGHDKGWTSALHPRRVRARRRGRRLRSRSSSPRTTHPMVEMRLFRSRVFAGGTVTMMLWAFGIFGIYFFTSIYLQTILGFSPDQGRPGLRADGPVHGAVRRARRAGSRLGGAHQTVALGMAIMAVGLYLFSRLGARRHLRQPDAWLPDLRGGRRPDERAADQRGPALDAGRAVRRRLRAAERLTRGRRAARHHGHRRGAAVTAGRRSAPRARTRPRPSSTATTRA